MSWHIVRALEEYVNIVVETAPKRPIKEQESLLKLLLCQQELKAALLPEEKK